MDTQISMDQVFLSKLDEILELNHQDEHFGVRELSSLAGVSRSKLHRKLNELKGQTASEYIKAYRLQKAYLLLKNNVSSVSEIAYAVGFNSPSYFSKCFNEHYSFLPSELKHKLEDEHVIAEPDNKKNQLMLFRLKRNLVIGFLILLSAFSAYVAIGYLTSESKSTKQVTLAVLPFKNLSDNRSDQYFADGVMDVILSNLSGVEGIHVISRTTMEQYRGTSKTIPEIGKELNISHLLEASIQKQTGKIRIIVQLIDAKTDVHVWSDDYERQYEDVFALQSDIAKAIVEQLEIKLSTEDEERISESPTKNFEAYNLYLKGRFFWDRRTEADLKRSIKYFGQAIALDSLYAPAYAGLGDAYLTMVIWGWYPREEGFKKGKMFAEKSLLINKNISSAYVTLGEAYELEWHWNQSEKQFKQAIFLDPNNATAHHFYAELLNKLGRREEAVEHIDLAKKYNPNAPLIYSTSSQIYYNDGEFEKSIEETKKAYELGGFSLHYRFYNYVRLHEYDKAVETLKLKFSKFKEEPEIIEGIYKTSGIEGVIQWYISKISDSDNNGCFNKARLYMLIGDSKSALDLLGKSYKYRNPSFSRIKHSLDFEPLKSEPRFISLVNKLNME
ncbi:helix-turn-helix domain-containing protein [Mariniflexile sp. HNIBRBA6329]|uniref:helix-turn-helix domain-containing protein n=1 Tax=Mariniflexile sp. HNIBRBA6329 TaxID=3373088 RepID=UPI0037455133